MKKLPITNHSFFSLAPSSCVISFFTKPLEIIKSRLPTEGEVVPHASKFFFALSHESIWKFAKYFYLTSKFIDIGLHVK